MADFFIRFFTAAPPLELAVILVLKIIEVSLGTVKVILIRKGFRREATALSFVTIMMWAFVASRVIMGIANAPIKGIVYCIGFATGVYLGSRLEEYIALGQILVQVIVSKENGPSMISALREKGYGVTTMKAQGRDSEKTILMIFANRKGKGELVGNISRLDKTAMIITNDVSALYGGTVGGMRNSR